MLGKKIERDLVKSVSWKGHVKRITFSKGFGKVDVPRSACVSKGAIVLKDEFGHLHVECREGDSSKFWPIYFETCNIKIGSLAVELIAKEITDLIEVESCEALEKLHYREGNVHGRTSKLIIRSYHPLFPPVIGYLELATPFLMNKARSTVFDAPFTNCSIAWKKWDKESLSKNINIIVRIARVVVAPEFRGLGIAQLLMQHAFRFARSRWQVSGLKPYFIEISADMLRYLPFAERSGMTLVGETQGNLHRVAKDMRYLLGRFQEKAGSENKDEKKKFEESCGICDQQLSRMTKSVEVMNQLGLSKEDFLDRLKRLDRNEVLKDYSLFREIVSLPKPHYMMGLNDQAHEFVQTRAKELGVKPFQRELDSRRTFRGEIEFAEFAIRYRTQVRRTKSTHAIQQAFGISTDDFENSVVENVNMKILPGEIVVITGPSGSGKTSVLRALVDTATQKKSNCAYGHLLIPESASVAEFEPFKSKKPLIEAIQAESVEAAIRTLSTAGLGEAYLYLKSFSELSAGQQYRAVLAKLICSKKNVWVVDEFCSNLDYVTSNVVAHSIQRLARLVGATLIVSTPDCIRFAEALGPDKVLLLRSSVEHSLLQGEEFVKKIVNENKISFKSPLISVSIKTLNQYATKHHVTAVVDTSTDVSSGFVWLDNGDVKLPGFVSEVIKLKRSELTIDHALRAGFEGLASMRRSVSSRLGKDWERVQLITVKQFCANEFTDES